MILFGYGQTVGPIEIAVMIWVSIDIVEELRQVGDKNSSYKCVSTRYNIS